MMFGYYGDHMGAGGWVGMALGVVLFWGLVGALMLLILRGTYERPGQTTHPAPTRPGPAEVLAHRFARGEIDEREYEARLQSLHEHGF